MTDFTNTVFMVIAGGVATLLSVAFLGWAAVVWTTFTESGHGAVHHHG